VVPLRFSVELEDFLARNDLPCSSVVRVAWALVLGCYLGTDFPSFPCFVDGETNLSIYSAIFEDNISIQDLLQKTKQVKEHAFQTSEKVFEIGALQDLNRSALFNTALSVTDTAWHGRGPFDRSSYLLHVYVTRLGLSHFIELQYLSPLINETQAHHIIQAFVSALEAVVYRPEQPVRNIDLISQLDFWQMFQWNRTINSTVDSCAHIEFHKMASAIPDAQAICSWEGSLTYGELDKLSSDIATDLVEMGVGPEMIVPLCFEKSYWAVAAMLGVWKAGGAYVCLDPSSPEARRQSILRSIDAFVIMSSMAHADKFTGSHLRVMIAGPHEINGNPTQKPIQSPQSFIRSHNAAYVVFTSGSTGEPKGIVIEHRSLCTSLREQGQSMEVGRASRFLQYAAYTFDVSVGDIFTTLTHGGCLCIPSEADRQNDLARAMERMQVNQACLTSSVANLIQPSEVPSLKHLTLGGEPASKQNVATWAEAVTLNNIYGPAECTVWCVINRKLANCEDESNIGKGIGATTWIVDANDHNKLIPIGAIGELLLEGPVLAREYLKDPTRTNEAFITDPGWVCKFGSGTSRRFYKTGDLAKYDSTGALIFQGRKDTQIKLRGQRIELGEIEHNLRKFVEAPLSLAAELVTPAGGTGSTQIAAFICLEGDFQGNEDLSSVSDSTKQHLRMIVHGLDEQLALCLPSYMIPSLFLPLKSLPLTTSGKIDRKRLRAVVAGLSIEQAASFSVTDAATYLPASTSMEKVLAATWAETLSRDPNKIGVNDNFIRLGGDSLAAMRLVSIARQKNIELTVSLVFQYPTLADLALVAKETMPSAEKSIQPFDLLPGERTRESIRLKVERQCDVPREIIEDILPSTPLQEAMFMQSISDDLTQFAQEAVELSPALDLVAYKAAWDLVVRRLPVTRTRLVLTNDSRVLQVVLDEDFIWQKPRDLEEYMIADQRKSSRPGEPLTRFALYEEPLTGRRVFVLSMHHSLFDGMSLGLMFDTVYRAYEGHELGASPPFNKFLQQVVSTISDPAATRYWRTRLSSSKARQFPTLPSPDYKPHARRSTEHLIVFSRDPGQGSTITISTVIRGAWALVLAQHTQTSDVVFGAFLAGRNIPLPGMECLAAPTFTNVPIRILVDPRVSILEYLQRIQDEGVAMIPYEHVGVQNIARLSHDARAACRFQNLLVVQPLPSLKHVFGDRSDDDGGPFPGKIISGPRVDANAMCNFNPYALLVECTILETGVFVRTSYDENVVGGEGMQEIVNMFEAQIRFLLRGPEARCQK
jgi:amino acid adenylation domain-containing protein